MGKEVKSYGKCKVSIDISLQYTFKTKKAFPSYLHLTDSVSSVIESKVRIDICKIDNDER